MRLGIEVELEQNSYFSHSLGVLCINSSPLHRDSSKEQLRVLLGLEKSIFYAGSNLSVALFGIGDLVGASPRSEQIMQILCVLSVGLVIHFVLKMLHHARRWDTYTFSFNAGESIAGIVVAGTIYGNFKTGIFPSSTIFY